MVFHQMMTSRPPNHTRPITTPRRNHAQLGTVHLEHRALQFGIVFGGEQRGFPHIRGEWQVSRHRGSLEHLPFFRGYPDLDCYASFHAPQHSHLTWAVKPLSSLSMTTVTPIRQTPLQALRNIMEVCECYENENVSAESAKQQLPRIRALAAQVIAQLSEPAADTVEQVQRMLQYHPGDTVTRREARDAAAVILNSAMTWGIGEEL